MILHVDMDAFYASVEERDRPLLAGQLSLYFLPAFNDHLLILSTTTGENP